MKNLLRPLFCRNQLEADMAEEMCAHIEEQTQRNIAAGMSETDARAAALRQFGGVAQIQELARCARSFAAIEQFLRDLRFAIRSLRRSSGFSVAIVLTLTLGLGAATGVFLLTDWVLFRSKPYPRADQLVTIGFTSKEQPSVPWCFGFRLEEYRKLTNIFTEFAAAELKMNNVVIGDDPMATSVARISHDTIPTLGMRFERGRPFLPEEFQSGADRVVVITHRFWRRRLDRDPAVLGREVRIDGESCRVVGVLAREWDEHAFVPSDVFRPLHYGINPMLPFHPVLSVIGRLHDGVTREQALDAMSATSTSIDPTFTDYFARQRPVLTTPGEFQRVEIYWLLGVAGALMYAISCLNATNLMLARVLGRQRELSVRLAVGGGRWRVSLLVLAESACVALITLLATLALTHWVLLPLLAIVTRTPEENAMAWIGWRTLGFTGILTVITGLLIGIIPASRVLQLGAHEGLRTGAGTLGDSRRIRRMRAALVVMQTSLAVMLLTGAGLMIRTFQQLQKVDLGFNPARLVKADLIFPQGSNENPASRLQTFQQLQEKLAARPEIERVGYAGNSLLPGGYFGVFQLLLGDDTLVGVMPDTVSENFAETAGFVVLRGRWLTTRPGSKEVVINEALAARRFGDADPIGQVLRLKLGDRIVPWTVAGVVHDVRENFRTSAGLHVYLPDHFMPLGLTNFVLRVRTDNDPALATTIRRTIYEHDPRIVTTTVSPLHQVADNLIHLERLTDTLLKALATIALLLAVVGLFSVLAYNVQSRSREFGLRSALGATPRDLAGLVIRHGMLVASLGLAIGLVGAAIGTRFMAGLLFGTTPMEPAVYIAVAVLLWFVAAFATWLPARRAAKVDPMVALRAE